MTDGSPAAADPAVSGPGAGPAVSGPAAGSGRRYTHHCVLRWSDLDAYGHVNNARFLTLYEEARVALMFAGGRASGLDSFAAGVVIRRHEVDYLRPIDYPLDWPDPAHAPTVRIEMWVEDLGAARFTIGYELFDGAVLAGRARSVLVPYDLVRKTARRLTDAEREFLRRYTADPQPAPEPAPVLGPAPSRTPAPAEPAGTPDAAPDGRVEPAGTPGAAPDGRSDG